MSWEHDAACIGHHHLFDIESTLAYPEAKAICLSCPVQAECLTAAMDVESGDRHHRHGVRGGLTPQERSQLAKEKTA